MERLGAASETPEGEQATEVLEARLKALSFSNRLKLLDVLQVPRTVDEIRLTSSREEGEGDRGDPRPLSREAVRHHLERLAEADLVRSELVRGDDGHTRKRYVLNESRLFDVAETLRGYCGSIEEDDAAVDRTQMSAPAEEAETWPSAPRLVLVHGGPGRAVFPLRVDEIDTPRGWVIGRGPDAQISLPYDPYISAQNSEILPAEGGFEIVNFRTARNGTEVNDTRLEPGEHVPLTHGDILRVGASALVFHGP